MLDKLSLKTKMLFAFMGISALLLVVGGIGWYSNTKVVAAYNVIATQNLPNVNLTGRLRYRAQEANRLILRLTAAKNAEEVNRFERELQESFKIYAEFMKKYREVPFAPGEGEIVESAEKSWEKFVAATASIIEYAEKGESANVEKVLTTEIRESRNANNDALSKLLVFHEEMAAKQEKLANESSAEGMMLIMVFIVAGFFLSIVVGLIFSNSLASSLGRISSDIAGAADHTSSSGEQLSAASQQLSSGSSEAAASLEETVASIEELTSMVKLNADHAKEANVLSQKSRESAEQGEQEITKLIGAMEGIARGSKRIEEIINVIDDIAFQTNLLALNAAVEAARAGEQGKGFAVVAEAVRTLALRSAEAAKDINTLIKENVSQSESGARIAGESGVVLKEIVTSVKKVADLNSEISVASSEQSNGLEQISKAMNQLDQATQGNAASSEEVAASSEEMSSQAVLLADLVVDLRKLVQGNGAVAQEAPEVKSKKVKSFKKVTTPAKKLASVAKKGVADVIPFDDENDGKIGNVSGF